MATGQRVSRLLSNIVYGRQHDPQAQWRTVCAEVSDIELKPAAVLNNGESIRARIRIQRTLSWARVRVHDVEDSGLITPRYYLHKTRASLRTIPILG